VISTRQRLVMIGASILGGVFIAGQARANSGLGLAIESSILAALISFGSGLMIISVILFSSPSHRSKLVQLLHSVRAGQIEMWGLVGGLLGGFFVMMQSWVAGVIGVALFSIGVVAGQAVAALFIDGYGLLGQSKRRLNWSRLNGIALTFSGLVVSADIANYQPTPLLVLPLIAGAGMGIQQGLNGRLGRVTASPVATTFLNFLFGTALIALTFLVTGDFSLSGFPDNPLLYLGGALGVTFIFLQVIVVQHIGTLVLGISLLLGQLMGSLAFDILLPVSSREVSVATVVGVGLALGGAVVVALKR
jgi:transporter family-2 protein